MGPLPLLQSTGGYFGQFGATTAPAWVFPVVIGGFLLLILVAGMTNRSRNATPMSPARTQRSSRRHFIRTAKSMGLSKVQIDLLEKLIKVSKVKQPMLVFTSPAVLDDVLKRGIYAVEASSAPEEAKQVRLNMVYAIKQLVENNSRTQAANRSTASIRIGQSLVISPESGGRYASKVVSNLRGMLAVTVPLDAAGREQRWRKGTRCKAVFWRQVDAGYAFATKVLGYNTIKGLPCMLLQHSRTLRREQQRRYRRKELSRPCFFYPIRVVQAGTGKNSRRAVVQQQLKGMGTIVDISAGGCSIRSRRPLKAGSLVKIELEITRRQTLVAFGKVRRVRKERLGGVMHVMFTKISAGNLNQIYSYVYNYTPMG